MQVKILAAIAVFTTQFADAAKSKPYYKLAKNKDDIGWVRSYKYQKQDR